MALLALLLPVVASKHVHGLYNATFPQQHIPNNLIIIGVSGLSSAVLQSAMDADLAPNLYNLMLSGSYTLQARAQAPTLSLPNWASILTSTSPAMHGVFDDNWTIEDGYMHPATGFCKPFPSVFSMIKSQHARLSTGVYVSWEPILQLFHHLHLETTCCDLSSENYTLRDQSVLQSVLKDISNNRFPDVAFLQFSQIRNIGESDAWGSPAQLQAINTVDAYIGRVLTALKAVGKLKKTLVIVTADVGGCGVLHGFYGRHYMVIPWIISAPEDAVDIKKNYQLQMSVSNLDTTATALYALRLQQAIQCTGRPVLEAFERFDYEDMHGLPGFGYHFSWLEEGVVDEFSNFTSSTCYRGTERCAQIRKVINPVFLSGLIAGVVVLLLGLSCLSVCCYYVRPNRRRHCWGIFEYDRIWANVKEDLDCAADVRNLIRRGRGLPPIDPSKEVEMEEHDNLLARGGEAPAE